MIDELEYVRRERPQVDPPSPEARRAALASLESVMKEAARDRAGTRRRWSPRFARLAPAAAMAVVVAVVAVLLGIHGRRSQTPLTGGGSEVVFGAQPGAGTRTAPPDAVAEAASILRPMVASLPGADGRTSVRSAGSEIIVHIPRGSRIAQSDLVPLMDTVGRLELYDWEANAVTPGGTTVANLLRTQDPSALQLSQGGGSMGPGSPGAGSMSLFSAVSLASRLPNQASTDSGRSGPQYFAFGRPGSSACAAVVRAVGSRNGTRAPLDRHCYLAGPTQNSAQLVAALPPGVSASSAQVKLVPQGIVILQAEPPDFARRPRLGDPSAQFYVLRDHVAVPGTGITHPTPSTDQSGSPNVTFGFTHSAAAEFQRVTARVAHRGELASGLGQSMNQHFAVTLGDQLLTVPSIDFRTYPDGIPGNSGADVTGGFTRKSSHEMATLIRLGSLPIRLQLVSWGAGAQ